MIEAGDRVWVEARATTVHGQLAVDVTFPGGEERPYVPLGEVMTFVSPERAVALERLEKAIEEIEFVVEQYGEARSALAASLATRPGRGAAGVTA
jgi:hypothetical protein